MKKLRFFKALFVAAALALVIPGCSGVDSDEGTNTPQTQGNKVALKISASEGYRTALPTVDLSSYTYELTADVMTENTPAGEPTALIPAGTLYADLTKANSVYVEADKTYLFVLKATDDSNGEILSGTLTQAINASNNSLSFKLFAIDSASDTGSVSIDVTYADGYGVNSVVPTLHKMDGTSLATEYPLTYTPANTAGTGRVTGSVPVGKSYVKIVLKDASSTEVGSIPQEAVYAVKGLTSSSAVNIQVKQYKATIALTTSDDSAPTLTLKNPAITTEGYAGISTSGEGTPFTVTKAGDSAPYTYTYTGYVPTAAYDVYKGATKIGTVQNVTPLELNESVTLESIEVAWSDGTAPTLYVGTTEAELRAALTVTATLSSGTNTVTDYIISGFDATSTSEQTVTVSYTYNGVTKNAQRAVTLVEDTISSIAVKTEPTTKTFTVGSELDLTGLVITTTYASGKTEDVAYGTDNASQFSVKYYSDEACGTEVTDITAASAGTYYAKITYEGKTTDKIAVTAEAGETIVTSVWDMSSEDKLKTLFNQTTVPSGSSIAQLTATPINGLVLKTSDTENQFKGWDSSNSAVKIKNTALTISGLNTSKTFIITINVKKKGNSRNIEIRDGSVILAKSNESSEALSAGEWSSAAITSTSGTITIYASNDTYITTITIEQASSTPTPTPPPVDLAVNGSLTAAYTIPSSATGNKGEETTITLSNVSVPTTTVTVSGDTSTTVAGAWAWDATTVTASASDLAAGKVTAKATFTPTDTSAYNTLVAQDVTITVTDERAEASTEVEVTAGKIYYWDLISDVASDSTATATVEDFVNGLKLAVAGGYTVDANYGLQLSANTTFTFPVVSNSRIIAYLTYTGGGAKEIALSVGGSALDSVSLNVGDCKAANGPVPVAWAYTGTAGTAVLTVPADVRIAKIVLDTTEIVTDSFVGATYTFTSDSNWVAYSGEKKTAKTYYPHLLSGTAGTSSIFWYGTNGLAVFNGGSDGLKTQPNSGNCPVYLTVPVYGACTITVVSSTLDNAPVIYNGGTAVATMTADSQTSTTYSASCKGLTGLNVLSIAIPSANASGTKTQQKIQSISIAEASNTTPVTFSLTAIGSSDITLSCGDGTVTATPPAGATVSAYSWIVDNVSVDTNTATLSVGSLAAGIHSIVVEATDSSTGVKYAAQYVLMVN